MAATKEINKVIVRYKSRKLQVKARVNNVILASNKVKSFEIPQAQYSNLLIL